MSAYPTINFTGNKRKLADWIIGNFPVKGGKVLDMFAGGCSVSYALKQAGFEVYSNDCLFANNVIAKAIIENDKVFLERGVFDTHVSASAIQRKIQQIGFLSNTLYFDHEIPELAGLLCIADTLKGYKKYIYLSLLRRAMIRKVPYSRMNVPWNKIVQLRDEDYSYRMYGRRRAYHNKSFRYHMLDGLNEYNKAVFSNGRHCKALREDATYLSRAIGRVDAVYLDPPYPSTMNDYLSFYGPFGMMFGMNEKSATDFTNRSTFLNNLYTILYNLSGKTRYAVLSINTNVNPAPKEVMDMMSNFGKVSYISKQHNYQVTGKANKSSSKELLITLAYR